MSPPRKERAFFLPLVTGTDTAWVYPDACLATTVDIVMWQ